MLKIIMFSNKIQLRYDELNKSIIDIIHDAMYMFLKRDMRAFQYEVHRGRLLVKGLLL